MSKLGKILWLVAGLSILLVLIVRFILGAWIPALWVPLVLFVGGVIAAAVVDHRFYFEFFTMRTTRYGFNMGTIIFFTLILVVALNYFSVRYNKTWDVTPEGLNSLSPQTLSVVKNLKDKLTFKVFYRGAQAAEERQKAESALTLYKEASPKIAVQYLDAFVEADVAKEYLKNKEERDLVVTFAEFGKKRVRVQFPYSEEQITSAIIKATRETSRKIYFLTGHGEKSLEAPETDLDGLRQFKQELEDSSYVVATLSLLDSPKLPEDMAALAIVGPQSQILDHEIKIIGEYIKKGGHLLIAADPGLRHQIALVTKLFGVEFKNNYVLNDRIRVEGRGAATSLGMVFDADHEITKIFQTGRNFTMFDIVSEVSKAPDAPKQYVYVDIVKTPPASYAVNELGQKGHADPGEKLFTVGIAVKGEGDNKFSAVVFGDSDFMSGKSYVQGLNRDLALNAVGFVASESELISILPRAVKGTEMHLTSPRWATTIIFALCLPVLLFGLSGFTWYRRRNA